MRVSRSWRRVLILLAALPFLLMLLATGYMLLMDHVELRPRTFSASLVWASETVTSVGYGGDSRWEHPVVVAYVVSVQFLGQCMVFAVFPMVLLPFLEERFEIKLAHELPKRNDYVLIYRHGPAVESILVDLVRNGVSVIVLEEDERTARRLRTRGFDVVHTDFDEHDPDLAQLCRARALILNGRDEDNAVLSLRARQLGFKEGANLRLCRSCEPSATHGAHRGDGCFYAQARARSGLGRQSE